jgi:ABC-type oligopeptide transport system substrate-binding subunit|tara:strand:- start:1252 stop:1437 length:186 start_codon:yes stop_codon:yes gene_type:complete
MEKINMNKLLIALSTTMLVLLAFAIAGCGETDTAEEPATTAKVAPSVPTAKELQIIVDTEQ